MNCSETKHTSGNYLFFLGGHDAEMAAIREILDENEIKYFDNSLNWGAKLSDYKEELKSVNIDQIPVFVELTLDKTPPENAVIIDHHNENSGSNVKTSLEQTACLLGIQLTRWQLLISANDRGYINEMKAAGATSKEIDEIRKFDRACQGVTEMDECNAESSVKNNLVFLNSNVILVNSLTNKTSAIVDRIYSQYKNIFIKTPDNQISFYGEGAIIENLKIIYGDLSSKNPNIKFWYGGGLPDNGYFGANHFYQEALRWIT